MKKLFTLAIGVALSCAVTAHASLDNQQFGKFRSWAEHCGYVYQGIVTKFDIQCYAFVNSRTQTPALAPLSSDTPDEAVNALIASNLAYRDAAATTPAPALTSPQVERDFTTVEAAASSQPAETIEQENACRSAREYLDYGAFSRKELFNQLKFEGYAAKDAAYAVDKVYRR
jgi:cell division septation protein DedD